MRPSGMSSNFFKLPPEFDWALFLQYLLGNCPADKQELVESWISESTALKAIGTGLWIRSSEASVTTSRVISGVEARIAAAKAASTGTKVKGEISRRSHFRSWGGDFGGHFVCVPARFLPLAKSFKF